MLPPELKRKYTLFESIFKKADASQVSQKDRVRFNVSEKMEFTYGEVLFPYFIPLFELTKPKPGEIFWDIGCGAGRPLAVVSLNFPQLSKCYGVELLEGLYELAKSSSLAIMSQSDFPEVVPIEIFQGDMLEVDWSNADIVYASSICFPDALVEGIADKCVYLKKGARVITLKNFPPRPNMRLDCMLKLKMTWGRCQVMIYTII